MGIFKRLFQKASDTTNGIAEPVQTVSNAVLIGGITAGLLVGGTYLYSKVKKKRD
jgi:hypothetical protein